MPRNASKPKRHDGHSTTRRQHHVWRSYLDSWATNGKIWCLQQERIFETSTINIAVERDFYKLRDLTDKDISLIRSLTENTPPPVKQMVEDLIVLLGMPGRLRELPLVANDGGRRALIDRMVISLEEKMYALFEGNIAPIFKAIRRKDLNFYDDPFLCVQFCHFLCLQNLRTKGVQSRIFAGITEQHGMSLERAWNVLRQITAVNAGGSLMLERKKRPLILLENETNMPFITGDQPVINLLSPESGTPPRLLAFYYPATPQLALILDEVVERTNYLAGSVSVDQVMALNQRIQAASHSQVFGSSRTALELLPRNSGASQVGPLANLGLPEEHASADGPGNLAPQG